MQEKHSMLNTIASIESVSIASNIDESYSYSLAEFCFM